MWKLSRYLKFHQKHFDTRIQLRSDSTASSFQEGREIEGFVVTQSGSVSDHIKAICLTHLETGAQYVHLQKNDQNNAFGVGFRTITADSTGLPHILEHTTLCGSKNFPCRDPFFKMINRSMATFMNAMTGPDFTLYPFSTQNFQDYKNLMAVYLDAVFNPLLNKNDFLQEGWRLEHENVEDRNSPIIIKGVVYNEMKGLFSDNQSLFSQHLLNSILPSHTYGHVWGGNPIDIPKLTHSDLIIYHKKHYNPSNAFFYSYGNFPLEYNLNYLSKNYLSGAKYSERYEVPSEKRWSSPLHKHVGCRLDPLIPDKDKQSTIAFSSLCSDVTNIQDTFEMSVLSTLLLKGPNSPFFKSLIESGLSAGFAPVTGYESQTKDTIFTVGLQHVRQADFDQTSEVYNSTIDKVINEGFDSNNIEAVLHEVELYNKLEGENYGIRLLMNIAPMWNHGANIVESLQHDKHLLLLRNKLKENPKYFQDKVLHEIKNEKHRLVLTMSPEEDYEAKKISEEEKVLKDKLVALSPLETSEIFKQGLELHKSQCAVQDVSSLPTLTVSDLAQFVEKVPVTKPLSSEVPFYVYVQPVDEVTHFRAVFSTKELDSELKSLVPLFCTVAPQMGTKNYSFREFEQLVRLKTGGFTFSKHISEDVFKTHTYEEGAVFYSHCLDKNVPDMYLLMSEFLSHMDLGDIQRFETLTRQLSVDLLNSIFDSGHHYAISSSASLVSPVARHVESWTGLTYIKKLQEIVQQRKFQEVLSLLSNLPSELIHKCISRAAVNLCEKNSIDSVEEATNFLKRFSAVGNPITKTEEEDFKQVSDAAVHHVHSIPVNFVSKSIMTVCYGDLHFAPLRVLARLLSNLYLHPIVRERGGAYGSGAHISQSGVFSFFSYRDPNSTATLDTFDSACDWVSANKFSDTDIEEAKLGILQKLDAPVLPEDKGMREFLYGIDDSIFNGHRQQVMNVTREQIHQVSEMFLRSNKCGKAIVGPKNNELGNRLSENWNTIN
ncbi:presequence protease, mitochondrial isoform X1 [Schistocerca piceifrons]|uniref:presequence protease, mitochondrial isoform X1 n=1 Tax=Schistocerca piceifrons TaxID=274613 RepID=UPI001F5FA1AC|nr:presequence protease, mitochondrial isoform X1 [Schistocerca piceifrons]XP_047101955.1 presequence protease, mitochondrial isoform X1 [Schistocerca piceifrons]XP_047101957.1 presequence protease, mitochondrial isoform X1 [Schistocerca piceifrons]